MDGFDEALVKLGVRLNTSAMSSRNPSSEDESYHDRSSTERQLPEKDRGETDGPPQVAPMLQLVRGRAAVKPASVVEQGCHPIPIEGLHLAHQAEVVRMAVEVRHKMVGNDHLAHGASEVRHAQRCPASRYPR